MQWNFESLFHERLLELKLVFRRIFCFYFKLFPFGVYHKSIDNWCSVSHWVWGSNTENEELVKLFKIFVKGKIPSVNSEIPLLEYIFPNWRIQIFLNRQSTWCHIICIREFNKSINKYIKGIQKLIDTTRGEEFVSVFRFYYRNKVILLSNRYTNYDYDELCGILLLFTDDMVL